MIIMLASLFLLSSPSFGQFSPPQWREGAKVIRCGEAQEWTPYEAVDGNTFTSLPLRADLPRQMDSWIDELKHEQPGVSKVIRKLLQQSEIAVGDYQLDATTVPNLPPHCEIKLVSKILMLENNEGHRIFLNESLLENVNPLFQDFILLRTSASLTQVSDSVEQKELLSLYFRGLFIGKPLSNPNFEKCRGNLACEWTSSLTRLGFPLEIRGLPYYYLGYNEPYTATFGVTSFDRSPNKNVFYQGVSFSKALSNVDCGNGPFDFSDGDFSICRFSIEGEIDEPGGVHAPFMGAFLSWTEPTAKSLVKIIQYDGGGVLEQKEITRVKLKKPFLNSQGWEVSRVVWDKNYDVTEIEGKITEDIRLGVHQDILIEKGNNKFFSYKTDFRNNWGVKAGPLTDISVGGQLFKAEEIYLENTEEKSITAISAKKVEADFSFLFKRTFFRSDCHNADKLSFLYHPTKEFELQAISCDGRVSFPQSGLISDYTGKWTYSNYLSGSSDRLGSVSFENKIELEFKDFFSINGVFSLVSPFKVLIKTLYENDHASGFFTTPVSLRLFGQLLTTEKGEWQHGLTSSTHQRLEFSFYTEESMIINIPNASRYPRLTVPKESWIEVLKDEDSIVVFYASAPRKFSVNCGRGEKYTHDPGYNGLKRSKFGYSVKKGLFAIEFCD